MAKHIELHLPGIRALRAYVGSMDSLVSMYRGESDIVSTHLLDGDMGEYNLPYIRRLLVGSRYVVIHLVQRTAGLFVQRGNPKRLNGWSDLAKPGLRVANRERGSGARVLLDEQLRLSGMECRHLAGYEEEHSNHLSVAGLVASGEADFGVGIEKAAQLVGGVDFVPLIREQYDLVMLKKEENLIWIEEVKRILASEAFLRELRPIQGYDLSQTGKIRFEN